jgi:cytochrome P450
MVATVAARATPSAPPTLRFRTPFGFLRRFSADPLSLLFECRELRGDLSRIRAPLIDAYVLLRPEHVRHVLQENHRNYWKGDIFQRLARFSGNGLLFSDGEAWLRRRRLTAPAFHPAPVAALAPMMVERSEALAESWERRTGDAVEIAAEMSGLALDIVSRALFGASVEGWKERFAENMAFGVEYANYLIRSLAPPPLWVPTRRNRGIRSRMRELDGFLVGAIEERRRSGGRGDLLDMLLEARDPETGAGLDDRELLDECITFITAGHETTAMTLAWCWSLLSRHPEVAARLHAELDAALAGRAPTVEDLPKLAYTRRVVEETLRLYPPAWAIPRQSHGPDEIGGFAIAARAAIFLSPYVTHRHPDLWENPEGFDPDRFLPERSAGRPRYAYFPFGGGMRMCIGREFALVEAQLVLATLARRFRLELVPGHLPVPDPILTLRPRGPVPMTLHRRRAQRRDL